MDPVIPPSTHRLSGHKPFDLVAKRDGCQIRAKSEGLRINHPNVGGYVDAYKGSAGPIAKIHCRQIRATIECPNLDRPDGGGYADAYEGPAVAKCLLPNLLQPIAENRGRQPQAI